MVEARFDYDEDDAVGEYMPVEDFRTLLREWRGRIESSAGRASSPLPETYRRNPMADLEQLVSLRIRTATARTTRPA